ncbi:MAG: hypothetical protein GY765_17040 [bacterium]|nr:hypothetical protein [bacterium]
MTCLKEEQLMLYIDGSLSAEERTQAKAHLSSCPACQLRQEELARSLRRVMGQMQLLEPRQVPPPDAAAVIAAARESSKPPARKRFGNVVRMPGFGLKPPALAAVIAFFIVSLVIIIIQFSRPADHTEKTPATFSILSIKMERQPAETYIVRDEKEKTTLVWVEKKDRGGNREI